MYEYWTERPNRSDTDPTRFPSTLRATEKATVPFIETRAIKPSLYSRLTLLPSAMDISVSTCAEAGLAVDGPCRASPRNGRGQTDARGSANRPKAVSLGRGSETPDPVCRRSRSETVRPEVANAELYA